MINDSENNNSNNDNSDELTILSEREPKRW